MATTIYVANLAVKATTIPPSYAYFKQDQQLNKPIATITVPVIDFSMLQSGTLQQRSKVLRDLEIACKDWGFFTVMKSCTYLLFSFIFS